jgi:SAM-dependent methyltransferase
MDLQRYYDTEYHGPRHASLITDNTLFTARASVEKWLYFRHLPPSAKVFDFGCGIGQSVALLPNACGWDLSRESREISRARGITIFETLAEVPPSSFDLVFSRHTLEHVSDPLRYLEDARRFAGHDGRLRLVLPGRERATITTHVDTVNLHLYCWTPQTVVNLLHVAGWRAEHVAYTPYGGYTKMLPLYRSLGPAAYRIACQMAARLTGTVELTVDAQKR